MTYPIEEVQGGRLATSHESWKTPVQPRAVPCASWSLTADVSEKSHELLTPTLVGRFGLEEAQSY